MVEICYFLHSLHKDVSISANTNHQSVSHKCKVVTGTRNVQFDERIREAITVHWLKTDAT